MQKKHCGCGAHTAVMQSLKKLMQIRGFPCSQLMRTILRLNMVIIVTIFFQIIRWTIICLIDAEVFLIDTFLFYIPFGTAAVVGVAIVGTAVVAAAVVGTAVVGATVVGAVVVAARVVRWYIWIYNFMNNEKSTIWFSFEVNTAKLAQNQFYVRHFKTGSHLEFITHLWQWP